MAEPDLAVNSAVVIPAGELVWRFSRSGGPGGQSVNTSDSRASLSWDVARSGALTVSQRSRLEQRLSHRLHGGVLTVTSSEERSQLLNRQRARKRMSALVAAALRPPPRQRRATKPTKASIERRLAHKRRRSQQKRSRRVDED
jgi:ribosome-associated protein